MLNAQKKLRNLRREEGTPHSQHLNLVIHLCKQIEPTMSEEKIILKFIRTMTSTDVRMISKNCPHTLPELREKMKQWDQVQQATSHQANNDAPINEIGIPTSISHRSRSQPDAATL